MLSHCANPQCSRPFLRLGEGKLFLLETEVVAKPADLKLSPSRDKRRPPRRLERYWLYDQCDGLSTLVHDEQRGIVLMPLPPASGRATAEERRTSA